MNDEYNDEYENKTSKINSAFLINKRLDELWRDAHKHSRQGKYSQWNADLDCLWSELGREYEINIKQQEEFNIINKKLGIVKNWTTSYGFKKISEKEKLEMARQYQILIDKELFLGRLQNLQGKGTAYSDGSEDDWD